MGAYLLAIAVKVIVILFLLIATNVFQYRRNKRLKDEMQQLNNDIKSFLEELDKELKE